LSKFFIPAEAWAQIPEDVRKMLYSDDNTNNNSNQPNNHTVHNTIANNIDDSITENTNNMTINNMNHSTIENESILENSMVNQAKIEEEELLTIYNNNRTSNDKNQNSGKDDTIININGSKYWKLKFVSILYRINANSINISSGYSLVDRGANGGLLGNDVRILHKTNQSVTITGIDNHQIGDLPIGTGAAYGMTHKGPVILIMHQYACFGHGTTVHSSGQ
jgi:hypothetical protein